MAAEKRKTPSALLSEAAKKTGRAVGQAAKQVVGKKPAKGAKSTGGLLSEAAKKAGRGVADAARSVVGKKPTQRKKSGSK
jgi:hypothetical protein